MPVYTLGISAWYHDSAAALLKDGEIVSAAHEERFTRKKHDEDFPKHAVEFCLKKAGISKQEIDAVVFYDKPFLKFERILKTVLKTWPWGFVQFIRMLPIWLHEKLFLRSKIAKEMEVDEDKVFFSEHHISHAASSVYTSPFEESAILVVDGVGEFATTSIGHFKNGEITMLREIEFPDSLGLLYSTMTAYLGFKVNSGEYKVMGLAPYGKDNFSKEIRQLIHVFDDGSFELNMEYFVFEKVMKMHSKKLEKLFGAKARKSESPLTQRDFDIAHSLQKLVEEIMLKLAREAQKITGSKNLCLSGGVALNCVANGKILREKIFENIYVQPAAGDAGGALGSALYYWYRVQKNTWIPVKEFSPYLGPEYSHRNIQNFLDEMSAKYVEFNDDDMCCKEVAKLINGDNVIGWFQGRAEFGPRALGNRSILADARNKENWKKVNVKIKFRESFRPFAPSVLEERCNDYFDLNVPSPYMLLVADVKTKEIPAVTHVDTSARIQSVSQTLNPKYYQLIKEFEMLTGCGVIINTSFNVRSEPIVLSPKDAWNCFIHTDMDYLVLGNFLIKKTDNMEFVNILDRERHLNQFALD